MEISSSLKKFLIFFIAFTLITMEVKAQNVEELPIPFSWPDQLRERVEAFETTYKGQIGMYIEDLNTKAKFTFNAGQRYYLASVIKLFVMIAIYKLINENKLEWKDTVKIAKSKYRDGAGPTNYMKAGQSVSVRRLVKFMMEKSDNAATDILIDIVGLSSVDDVARRYGVFDLGELTTLLDVRKIVFRNLHPLAGNLTAMDYIELWKIRNDYTKKLALFSKLINKPNMVFTKSDLDMAFFKYYQSGYNSASLIALSEVLKKLAYGEVISKDVSQEIIAQLDKCHTGSNRIKKSMPPNWTFAHKTGTQHKRVCDAGIASGPGGQKIAILICAGDFEAYGEGEAVLAKLAGDFFELYQMEPKAKKVDDDFWKSPF